MHICLYNTYIDIVKILILYKYNSLFFIKLYIFIPTHFNAKNLKFPINQGLRTVQKNLHLIKFIILCIKAGNICVIFRSKNKMYIVIFLIN